MLSFVCSVGNIPLAAVLWSGGISFAGVIAFVFADLLVLPIIAIYRKYYGSAFALQIVALMFVTIVIAALAVDGLFGAAGLIPHTRPTRADIFNGVKVDYQLFANIVALAVFSTLFALTPGRGGDEHVRAAPVEDRDDRHVSTRTVAPVPVRRDVALLVVRRRADRAPAFPTRAGAACSPGRSSRRTGASPGG